MPLFTETTCTLFYIVPEENKQTIDQCSPITKGSRPTIIQHYVHATIYTTIEFIDLNWTFNGSIYLCFIFVHTVFLLCAADK